MKDVYENIYVGSKEDLIKTNEDDFAFVHATKSMFKGNKNEVLIEEENHLYINWVDSADMKYFDFENNGVKIFIKILDFIDKWIKVKKVFIHCDEGISRSPTIAMIYMSKRLKVINNKDHVYAEHEFQKIYENYWAGKGISDFVFKNWFKIN